MRWRAIDRSVRIVATAVSATALRAPVAPARTPRSPERLARRDGSDVRDCSAHDECDRKVNQQRMQTAGKAHVEYKDTRRTRFIPGADIARRPLTENT